MAFYVRIGCVSFTRYCGEMYSGHLFLYGGLCIANTINTNLKTYKVCIFASFVIYMLQPLTDSVQSHTGCIINWVTCDQSQSKQILYKTTTVFNIVRLQEIMKQQGTNQFDISYVTGYHKSSSIPVYFCYNTDELKVSLVSSALLTCCSRN